MNADISPAIEISHLSFSYGTHQVLDDITLSVRAGDYYLIIGPNGGGKTTLIRLILGILQPDFGSVSIFGKSVSEGKKSIGYVPQYHTCDFSVPMTVKNFVRMGCLSEKNGPWRRYSSEDERCVSAVLEKTALCHVRDRLVSELSGGERQRVIVARALVSKPEILLLDEPTVYIDAPSEQQFHSLLADLSQSVTIVLITHNIGVISSHVTKIACLNRRLYTHENGKITSDMIEATYGCSVEFLTHGPVPHRVLADHPDLFKEEHMVSYCRDCDAHTSSRSNENNKQGDE